jgi:uncharacterized protein YbbC (DUF1343 family)
MGNVLTGLEVLLGNPNLLKSKRVGLIDNLIATTSDCRHALDALLKRWDSCDQSVWSRTLGARHKTSRRTPRFLGRPQTGLPLLNQFGMNPSEMVPLFGEVDELVFDIQDVGTRFYT